MAVRFLVRALRAQIWSETDQVVEWRFVIVDPHCKEDFFQNCVHVALSCSQMPRKLGPCVPYHHSFCTEWAQSAQSC